MKKMKLFVWPNVLSDYTPGIMFALAHDVDEARQMIMNSEKDLAFWERFERELASQPDVYDQPIGFALWGGG